MWSMSLLVVLSSSSSFPSCSSSSHTCSSKTIAVTHLVTTAWRSATEHKRSLLLGYLMMKRMVAQAARPWTIFIQVRVCGQWCLEGPWLDAPTWSRGPRDGLLIVRWSLFLSHAASLQPPARDERDGGREGGGKRMAKRAATDGDGDVNVATSNLDLNGTRSRQGDRFYMAPRVAGHSRYRARQRGLALLPPLARQTVLQIHSWMLR
ncbi:hypothetical protein HDV57DRAFT_380380 [Trichoderma longibrachiatum]